MVQRRAKDADRAPVQLGPYALYAPIASGGMATVHLARATETGGVPGIVAIKRLHAHYAADPEFTAMFMDEARVTQRIRHENVVPTLDVFAIDGEIFLVMPYVSGETLSRLTRNYAPPPFDVVARVIADALHGLHAAHIATTEAGDPLHIIHRDVSPQNIIVDTNGVAKLLDFGVAKAVGRMQHTRDGEVKGKLAYMPPEQLRGHDATPQSDVYSVGVVLWEFLTGKRLFKGDNEGVIVARILDGVITPPKEIWATQAFHTISMAESVELAGLDDIAMRALARDPKERFGSAHEMVVALEAAIAPAPREDVAKWVKEAARELLALRSDAIAEIQSGVYDLGGDVEPVTECGDALLPVIVADLADAHARDLLARVADAHGTVLVPLVHAPVDRGEHVLEVHIPGEAEPTLFYASPVGPPEANGFPLSLRSFGDQKGVEAITLASTDEIAARTFTQQPLSSEHTRDLASGPNGLPVEANVLGRTLANGKLHIESRIGGGGGGSVYRARHSVLRRPVAVKVLHDTARYDVEFCARFHAEALAASALDHLNLVRVIDFGQEPDGLLYLSMEYLDGVSLRDLVHREGPLPVARALEIVLQVCAGLAHAHLRGVVHRDIKPSNVVLVAGKDDDGRAIEVAKVCDFGIAVRRVLIPGSAQSAGGNGDQAEIAGTPAYMSPEQCRGSALDGRSDVYSTGVMLYELLTGKLPFRGRDDRDFLNLHVGATPTPPSSYLPGIDARLERLILKALAKVPAQRVASMRELRSELKDVLSSLAERRAAPRAESVNPPPQSAAERPASIRPPWLTEIAQVGPLASESVENAQRDAELLALEIAHAPQSRLNAFARERGNVVAFAKEAARLEAAIRVLANRGDATTLSMVARVVTVIYEESLRAAGESKAAQSATALATRLLHTIADPGTLLPIATLVLSANAEPGEARLALLVWAQVAGAIALYHARTKLDGAVARTRFISAMRLVGASSAPAIRAALQHLMPKPDAPVVNSALAIDLIRSAPSEHDEAMGSIISRYVRTSEPELSREALLALVHVWGERAKPLFLASLQSPAEALRIVALRGLKAVGGVDEFVVRKIESVVVSAAASDDFMVTAAESLAYATPSARHASTRVVLGELNLRDRAGRPRAPAVVIAMAKAALVLSRNEALLAIQEAAKQSAEPLRSHLRSLL